MKNTIFSLIFGLLSLSISAQGSKKTKVFLSGGYVSPQYISGSELIRSKELRDQGLSYYQKSDGTRQNVGSYPNNSGFAMTMGFQSKIQKIKGLWLGAIVSSNMTGSQPSNGGYAEGYYFNFINFGLMAKYYPVQSTDFYLKGEVGLGSVLTKNRFINDKGAQDFFHQFGIGNEFGLGLGYAFTPFSSNNLGLYLEANYQILSTRVEVSDIGDDIWKFNALQINVGVTF